MDLKKILKTIRLHQEQISMFFGIIILIIAAIFVVKYIRSLQNPTQVQEAAPQNNNQTHLVTKGETLWSISYNYYQKGSEWKTIADANNISDPSKLEVGTNLTIPEAPSPEPVQNQVVSESPTPSPVPQLTKVAASIDNSITGANYTVVKGDNLWKIAVRAYGDGFKWVDIASANHLHNPSLIHSGNVFIIPR